MAQDANLATALGNTVFQAEAYGVLENPDRHCRNRNMYIILAKPRLKPWDCHWLNMTE
jgi:hypothetical protein